MALLARLHVVLVRPAGARGKAAVDPAAGYGGVADHTSICKSDNLTLSEELFEKAIITAIEMRRARGEPRMATIPDECR